jgi:type IV pilus assembly protein PilA
MAVDDRFCRVCGKNVEGSALPSGSALPVVGTAETSGKAIASLICGFLFFFPPIAIVAVIFGHLALSEIRKSAGHLTGRGLAVAGLVMGYAGVSVIPILIIAAIAIPNLLRARMAANEASAVATLRALSTAEVSYSTLHPELGYTCSLSELHKADLVDAGIESGQKNGYAVELLNCRPGDSGPRIVKFQLVARPVALNQTGMRAFCSDESAVIKVDSGGSTQMCLEGGEALQ